MHHLSPYTRGRRIAKFALLLLVIVPLVGFVVMSLWNALVPDIFGLKAIGFWQALGLLLLSRLLFGSFAGRAHHHHRRMHERWAAMTEEERAMFRRAMGWSKPDDGASA